MGNESYFVKLTATQVLYQECTHVHYKIINTWKMNSPW